MQQSCLKAVYLAGQRHMVGQAIKKWYGWMNWLTYPTTWQGVESHVHDSKSMPLIAAIAEHFLVANLWIGLFALNLLFFIFFALFDPSSLSIYTAFRLDCRQKNLYYFKTIYCNYFFLFTPYREFDLVLLQAKNVPLTQKFLPTSNFPRFMRCFGVKINHYWIK